MTPKVILIAAASTAVGRLAAHALSHSGHTIYAGLPRGAGSERHAAAFRRYSRDYGVDIRPLRINPLRDASVECAVEHIITDVERIDVIVHTSEDYSFGPAEAFTVGQLAAAYDRTVLSAQRANRSIIPHMRRRGKGLLVWVTGTCVAGGTLPFLAPQIVMKAALDAMAVHYARELVRWGIETTIVVPSARLCSSSWLEHALPPADVSRARSYTDGPLSGISEQVRRIVSDGSAPESDMGPVAGSIVEAVDTPIGERPFRLFVDGEEDGGRVALAVADRMRDEMLRRVGLADLLKAGRQIVN